MMFDWDFTVTGPPVLLLIVLLPVAAWNKPVPLVNEFSIMEETAKHNPANTKDTNLSKHNDITDDVKMLETDLLPMITEEVENCYKGKCHACFTLWRFKGCIYLEKDKDTDGISVTLAFAGKKIFSQIVKEGGLFDISTDQLPSFIQKRIDGPIVLKVSHVLTDDTLLCAQVDVNIKGAGRVRWPSSGYRCFRDAPM